MEVKKKNNGEVWMHFDSDDEFYNYCVVQQLVPKQYECPNGEYKWYSDWSFSDEYLNDIANGVKFLIKDENSQIYKHGGVSFRTIAKPVQNLEPFDSVFTDLDDELE